MGRWRCGRQGGGIGCSEFFEAAGDGGEDGPRVGCGRVEAEGGSGEGFTFDPVGRSADGALGEKSEEIVEIGGEGGCRCGLFGRYAEFETKQGDFGFVGFSQQRHKRGDKGFILIGNGGSEVVGEAEARKNTGVGARVLRRSDPFFHVGRG